MSNRAEDASLVKRRLGKLADSRGGTFRRPDRLDDSTNLYIQSYLWIRVIVGAVGVALPIIFIIGEAFLGGGVHARGSISAYYHTPMRDVFVGGLSIVGVLLATYMSGKPKSLDFGLSLVAGLAVLIVVIFPTWRPPGQPDCTLNPIPSGCSLTEHWIGQRPVAWIHASFAAVFILSLAAIAFLFGYRAKKYERDRKKMNVQVACGIAIILAVIWVLLGGLLEVTIEGLTPLYLGEVISVAAFGISWFVQGAYLRLLFFPFRPTRSVITDISSSGT